MQLRNDQVKREEMFDLFVLKSKQCLAVPFSHSLPQEDDLSKQIQKFKASFLPKNLGIFGQKIILCEAIFKQSQVRFKLRGVRLNIQ